VTDEQASFEPRDIKPGWPERQADLAAEGDQMRAIAEHEAASSGGGHIDRVVAELSVALSAARQARESESNVGGFRKHSQQHAYQAWLLLNGSVPASLMGVCNCALL
jgi:hypothetical protein